MDRLRKQVDKLVSRRPEDDVEPPYEDENPDQTFPGSQSGFLSPFDSRQAGSRKRHVSEPAIYYDPSGIQPYDPTDTLARHGPSQTTNMRPVSPIGDLHPHSAAMAASNPLGMNMVYSCPDPALDFVFVHGVGGTSTGTWSWGRDPANFWPPWLANDTDLYRSRIFSYGYGAGLTGPYTTLSILDFAKDLLFNMKTYSGQGHPHISIGSMPIVFVVHSMGGLVAKKAYIIGKTDPQYEHIISNVSAMVFLATPHKGSHLAQTLNNILRVTPGGCPKNYVAELEKNSGSLQDINEQFRNMCGNLELVSFFETMKTNIGAGVKKLIVEKDSALLEYPGETSSSLIADHHGMVKFKDPLDANFINVTNVLRWLMKKTVGDHPGPPVYNIGSSIARPPSRNLALSSHVLEEESRMDRLKKILGILENHDEDLDLFTGRIMPGSCQWLLRRQSFQDWAANSPDVSGFLWITGTPGSGKSTLASLVINLLRSRAYAGTCQYHFFLAGDQTKKTLSYLLRTIAFQAALSSEQFCSGLMELHDALGITFSQQKAAVVWERIFEGLLFRLPAQGPFFWIIDGLDEAESANDLLKLVSKIRSAAKVNVLLISRPTNDLSKYVNEHLPSVVHEHIDSADTFEDIRDYVQIAVQKILPDGHSQEDIVQDIMSKASGSFLWVKLALDRIRDNWYTKADIRIALDELPAGMESLYERMVETISRQPERTRGMATRILTWVTCSFSPLDVTELEVALKPEFEGFVNLGRTAEEICGQFVVVNKSKVTLIHHTARQFLLRRTVKLPATIPEQESHTHAATRCIDFLSDAVTWRRVFSLIQLTQQSQPSASGRAVFDGNPFLFYALTFWTFHVSHASVDSDDFLGKVLAFLEEFCLLWINGVALTKNLRILTRAAQNLKTYVRRRAHKASKGPPRTLAMARDGELRQWTNDIIRVVGRFGNNVAENPASVYKYVVPFCPNDSIIAKTFGFPNQSGFSVTGLSSGNWDDCLARLSLGEDRIASRLLCKDNFVITLLATGGIMVVWRAETFEEARRITHGEYVTQMAASKTSNLVATAGFKSTKVWDITTGTELHCLPKARHHHTKALAFAEDDNEIMIAYDDCEVQCFDLKTAVEKWRFMAKEPNSRDFSCARCIAFSPDRLQLAVVFRGRPVLVWNVQKSSAAYSPPRRCVLAEDRLRSAATGDAWNAPEYALWHPVTDSLLILYEDTKIVEWNIAQDEQEVYDHTAARSMTLSQDGNFLLTSDVNGTLSIYVIPGYRLMYRMKYDELVTDLAFSPDETRFYDLRGSFCNVWEPDALVRADNTDRDDMSSSHETNTSEPILSSGENSRTPVTSLVCDSSGRFYCVGKEDGSVSIHSIPDGRRVRKLASHSSSVSVIKLAWSTSQKYLASVDDSGRVLVKRLVPPTAEKDRWAVFPVCDIRMENNAAVERILFSARDEYLLISTSSYACVLGMKAKKEVCRMSRAILSGGSWFNHPKKNSTLLRIDGSTERQYLWKTLEPVSETVSEDLSALTLSHASKTVGQAVQVSHRWLVLDVLESDSLHYQQRSRNRNIELVDLTKLKVPPAPSKRITRRYVVEGLAKHCRQLVGCFQDRVIFLDHQFWLCTWEVEPMYSKHKRHFFLPKHWVSASALKWVVLNDQGTLLCPRDSEVVIVRAGFGS